MPERITVHADLRHPDAQVLDEMDTAFRAAVAEYCEQHGVTGQVDEHWHMPVTRFDDRCISAVREATAALGYSNLEMVSGAGHDSLYLAKCVPTGMIFVPCEDGISHNEAENAKPEDLTAGANVLLHAMLRLAA